MATLDRRLEALEASTPDAVRMALTVSFVKAFGPHEEATSAAIGAIDGTVVMRKSREKEAKFLSRVEALAIESAPPAGGIVLVFLRAE